MKKLFWLAVGIAAGMAASKRIQEDPKAAAVYNDIAKRVRDLGSALNEGFVERSTELNDAKKGASESAQKTASARKAQTKGSSAEMPSSNPTAE